MGGERRRGRERGGEIHRVGGTDQVFARCVNTEAACGTTEACARNTRQFNQFKYYDEERERERRQENSRGDEQRVEKQGSFILAAIFHNILTESSV